MMTKIFRGGFLPFLIVMAFVVGGACYQTISIVIGLIPLAAYIYTYGKIEHVSRRLALKYPVQQAA